MSNKLQTITMQLDDDVWAECQRLGKEHGTINEGMAAAHAALRTQEMQEHLIAAIRAPSTPLRRLSKPPLLKPSERGKK